MSKFVLIVDDNPSDLLLAQTLVESEGITVLTAEDGFGALDKIAEYDIVLMIVDLQMPRMSGIELLKRVSRISKMEKVPRLVMSSRNEVKDVKMAVQSGASDYVTKPLDHDVFNNKVKKHIGGEIENWKECPIPPELANGAFYIMKDLELKSISELGGTFASESDLSAEGTVKTHLHWAYKENEIHIQTATMQIGEVEKDGNAFIHKFDFVGLTEKERAQIRQYCIAVHSYQAQKKFEESA